MSLFQQWMLFSVKCDRWCWSL